MLTTLLEPRLRLTICGLDELDAHGTAAGDPRPLDPRPRLSRAARLCRLRPAPSADHALPRHHRPLARLGGARARTMSRRWSSSAGNWTTPARISAICWSTATPASRARPPPWRPCSPATRPWARRRASSPASARSARSPGPTRAWSDFADDILGRGGRLNAALREHYRIQAPRRPEFVEELQAQRPRGRGAGVAASRPHLFRLHPPHTR